MNSNVDFKLGFVNLADIVPLNARIKNSKYKVRYCHPPVTFVIVNCNVTRTVPHANITPASADWLYVLLLRAPGKLNM